MKKLISFIIIISSIILFKSNVYAFNLSVNVYPDQTEYLVFNTVNFGITSLTYSLEANDKSALCENFDYCFLIIPVKIYNTSSSDYTVLDYNSISFHLVESVGYWNPCSYDNSNGFVSCLISQGFKPDSLNIKITALNSFFFTITSAQWVFPVINSDSVADEINSSINSSDVDSDGTSSSISNFGDMVEDNANVSNLIALPVTLFSRILDSMDDTCTSFSLGTLFGSELVIPCINMSDYLGNALWEVIDVLFSGFFIYMIGRKLVKIFNNFTNFKEGDVLE